MRLRISVLLLIWLCFYVYNVTINKDEDTKQRDDNQDEAL
jgi:lipopolysaccharide export system protein LptC